MDKATTSNNPEIRLRFAPSPTGYLHVGNARTAVLNWLFARRSQGKLVLRIEDTDSERSEAVFYESLLEDLKWLGIDWDEGPDCGGQYGPYNQSQRFQTYRNYADKLLDLGLAFRCYCSAEEVKAKSDRAISNGLSPRYDGTCYELTEDQIHSYEKSGRRPVLRFRVMSEEVVFEDLVHEEVRFARENINDFVIIRADGKATYNFAAALDDALMKISHVVRGEDHLSNTPKQALLCDALSLPRPVFVHIPMILGRDRSKLSKRHGDNQVRQYRDKGYLPEALINFLSLLSWSSPTGDEILPVDRLIREFDLSRLSKSAAIFDLDKFNWMNGWYMRNNDFQSVVALAVPFLKSAGYDLSNMEYVERCIAAVLPRVDNLQELAERCAIFFRDAVKFENEALIQSESSKRIFNQFLIETDSLAEWDGEVFRLTMKNVQKETGIKGKELWMPFRVAFTGVEHGPELPTVVEILGKEKSRKFIQKALNA